MAQRAAPRLPAGHVTEWSSSPLRGFDAAADPVVRAGANGLFFYSGIAFQRGAVVGDAAVAAPEADKHAILATSASKRNAVRRSTALERSREAPRLAPKKAKASKRAGRDTERSAASPLAGGETGRQSVVFVATYLDLNNRENGDPIHYVRTSVIDRDPGTRFLDKPWSAVDVPRPGAATCAFDMPQEDGTSLHQEFPAGRVYFAYSAFTGEGASLQGEILFSSSSDCGATSVFHALAGTTSDVGAAIRTIPVGDYPVDVAVSPDGERVYVANYFGNDVSVIDATTNYAPPIATIAAGQGPRGIAVNPDGTRVYVANFVRRRAHRA